MMIIRAIQTEIMKQAQRGEIAFIIPLKLDYGRAVELMFQMFARSLVPLLSQDEYLNSTEADNTQVLENILYGVTSLVIILVIILIYVSVKTRLSQNRFKLLDNSGEEGKLKLTVSTSQFAINSNIHGMPPTKLVFSEKTICPPTQPIEKYFAC